MSPPKDDNSNPPERVQFALDEAVFSWLSPLLDGYAVTDRGVNEAVAREEKEGRALACARGCASCCRSHTTIPVYPLELVGLTWYASEKLEGATRDKVKTQLRAHASGEPCPFLVEGVCSIHPLRPMACRQFNVFGQACAEGEDAYYSRREDVLTPIQKYADEAFMTMLPFYGVNDPEQQKQVIKSGQIHQLARVLQECSWASVADKMDDYDARRSDSGKDKA